MTADTLSPQPAETPVRALLLQRIEDFCTRNRVSRRQFGLAANNDHQLVAKLEGGRLSLATIEKIEALLGRETMPPPAGGAGEAA